MARFHDCAGRLSDVDACDFGALVLENAAETVTDPFRP